MKNLLFTIAFTFASVAVSAQARIGSTASDIKDEFSEGSYNLKSGYDKDGDYFITIETEKTTTTYYFNSDRKCTSTFVIPDNQGALNYYVEMYNKKYVIINSKEWKMYSDGGILSAKLIFPTEGGYFFVWRAVE